MSDTKKYDRILDALHQLLEDKTIQNISVSEIARKAGIGKGSIYYYFPSKEAILDALIERNYEKPLKTAKNLAAQTDISPFTRMALIFQACRNSSDAFLNHNNAADTTTSAQDVAFLHQKYMNHLIAELKPSLTEIIKQGITSGDIQFEYPAALAEIVLIVLAVKLNNTFLSSTAEDSEETIRGLVALLEKGTGIPQGTLNYLTLQFSHPYTLIMPDSSVKDRSGQQEEADTDSRHAKAPEPGQASPHYFRRDDTDKSIRHKE